MHIHTIEARTHGRYLVDRPAGDGPFPMLVGFHGYSEGAERMLDELRRMRGDRRWILVSIQALNRFYSRASTVVAGWMTREDRELAIDDNLRYVRSVVTRVQEAYPAGPAIVFAGFSQGVAMAYRAAAFVAGGDVPAAAGVIVLAGDIPPDVAAALPRFPPVLLGYGTEDHFYTAAKAAIDAEEFRKAGVVPQVHVFSGGHVWDESFVAQAGAFLDTIVPSAPRG